MKTRNLKIETLNLQHLFDLPSDQTIRFSQETNPGQFASDGLRGEAEKRSQEASEVERLETPDQAEVPERPFPAKEGGKKDGAKTRPLGVVALPPSELLKKLENEETSDVFRPISHTRKEEDKEGKALLRTLPRLSIGEPQGPPPAEGVDFSILRVLGEGGMGKVYEAEQHSLERPVALKQSKEHLAANGQDFLHKEALITGKLEHPNIIPVHLLGCDESGTPVMVMKRIEGVEWRILLRDKNHPAWSRWRRWAGSPQDRHLEILMEIANALHFAHSKGILHRDLKPSNVMIGEFGEVYLLDWGIATKLPPQAKAFDFSQGAMPAGFGHVVGTPSYMAPEMLIGSDNHLDPRTDVYLLGASLYEVLTGHPPHLGDVASEVFRSILCDEPSDYPSDTPAELIAICKKALQVDPGERFPDAMAFRTALEDYFQHRGSIKLCLQGDELLLSLASFFQEGVEVMQAKDKESQAVDLLTHQRLTESRFAYTAALREWPENERAKQGLERCLEWMVKEAIQRRDAKSARLLLQDLREEKPDLAHSVEALEQALAHEKATYHRLVRMEEDLDLGFSLLQQRAFCLAMVGFGVILALFFVSSFTADPMKGHKQRFFLIVGNGLFALIVLYLLRHKLLKNSIGRRFLGNLFVLLSGIVFLRGIHWYLLLPANLGLIHEALLMAFGFGVMANFFYAHLWLPAFAFLGLALWQTQTAHWDPGMLHRFATGFWIFAFLATYARPKARLTS